MRCPRCSSDEVTKDGTTQLGGQRLRCTSCSRRFTRRSGSAFSRRAFPDDIIAISVRWYVRYRLSYAEVSEWLAEHGVVVDQSTIYRWVQRYLPLFGEAGRRYRRPVGLDWRVDETYARIRGRWHYIYRAIDGHDQIVGAYVSRTRDMKAARAFFERAIASTGTTPRRVITDKAAAYPPALDLTVPGVLHRTKQYRTKGIERDHGFLKERLRPMRGLKSVASTQVFSRGHALMRNIGRGFVRGDGGSYSAAGVRLDVELARPSSLNRLAAAAGMESRLQTSGYMSAPSTSNPA